jgi:hypothetical protein
MSGSRSTARFWNATVPNTTAATAKMKTVTGRLMEKSTIFNARAPIGASRNHHQDTKTPRGYLILEYWAYRDRRAPFATAESIERRLVVGYHKTEGSLGASWWSW